MITPSPALEVPPPIVAAGREISCGRFQPVLGLAVTSGINKDGADRLAFNEYFALFRSKEGTLPSVPQRGEAGFALSSSQAFVRGMTT